MENIKLSKADRVKLVDTINSVEGISGLISAETDNVELIEILTKKYVKELAKHRAVWYAILIKYIGDPVEVSKNVGRYRYDTIQNIIFKNICTCGTCDS